MEREQINEAVVFEGRYTTWSVGTVSWSGMPRIERAHAEGSNRRFFRPFTVDFEYRGSDVEFETEDDSGASISFSVPMEAVAEFMRRAGWNVSRREVIEASDE